MRVDQEEKGIVADRFAFEILHVDGVAAQEHSEAANERRIPLLVAHLVAAGIEPHHVANLRAANPAALERISAGERPGVRAASWIRRLREIEERLLRPRRGSQSSQLNLVILAIGVVVALLCAGPFVAGGEHRHALRKEERGEEIAALLAAELIDLRDRRSALRRRGSRSDCCCRRRDCLRRWLRCVFRCS